jgi:hypothetical protein
MISRNAAYCNAEVISETEGSADAEADCTVVLKGARPYRAPFNVHDVVQVTVVPRSHLLQTATH